MKKRKLDLSSDEVQVWLMMIIPIISFILLVIYPILWNFRYAFYNYNGVSAKFIGIDNFLRVIGDASWWRAVANTFQMSAIKIIIAFPLAFFFALLLNNSFRGRDVYRIINFIPFILSMSVMSMAFKIMFSGNAGIMNELLRSVGIIKTPIEWLGSETTAKATIIGIWVWKDLGYLLLLILAGLQSIDRTLYESASIDGANTIQKVFFITIPQLMSILIIIIMLEISGSLKVFDLVNVLTAGGPNGSTDVMMTYLFNYYFGTDVAMAQQGYAAATGIVASAIISIVTIVYLKVSALLKK